MIFNTTMLRFLTIILCFFVINSELLAGNEAKIPYKIEYKGINQEDILCTLMGASRLEQLIDHPPHTMTALKRRADDDVTNLFKALQSLAYYNPSVSITVNEEVTPIIVNIDIDVGVKYQLASVEIKPESDLISIEDLGLNIGSPAYPADIIKAEETIADLIENQGYPLVKILKHEVIADQSRNSISVVYYVDTGPFTTFGITDITGNKCVLPEFFIKKIHWCEGARYDPKDIERTIAALESSGLFSSIDITHDEETSIDNHLPMHISVKEAKFRSIAFGVGYATDLGAGVSGKWEHRNVRGMGEKVSIVGNIWQIKQEGYIRYIKPDFYIRQQDLIWQAEVERETTKGFTEASVNLSGTIERQFSDVLRISYGAGYTWLRNTHSNNNGDFHLIKFPMQAMWNYSNNLLDPTTGYSIHVKTTPILQTLGSIFAYSKHQLTTTVYQPLDTDHRFVLAGKATFGTIWGSKKHRIPPSERFYAGSDTLLRGYRYLTVSPLNCENDPTGGRSLMAFSLEARMRLYDPFGIVVFYDVGNVYNSSIPRFDHHQLQSVGIGLRYHTPIGPLRLDFAIPLNPRNHVDSAFQIYFSIGQSF